MWAILVKQLLPVATGFEKLPKVWPSTNMMRSFTRNMGVRQVGIV